MKRTMTKNDQKPEGSAYCIEMIVARVAVLQKQRTRPFVMQRWDV